MHKTHRILLTALLCLVLCVCLLPSAFADDDNFYTAISESELQEAFAAINSLGLDGSSRATVIVQFAWAPTGELSLPAYTDIYVNGNQAGSFTLNGGTIRGGKDTNLILQELTTTINGDINGGCLTVDMAAVTVGGTVSVGDLTLVRNATMTIQPGIEVFVRGDMMIAEGSAVKSGKDAKLVLLNANSGVINGTVNGGILAADNAVLIVGGEASVGDLAVVNGATLDLQPECQVFVGGVLTVEESCEVVSGPDSRLVLLNAKDSTISGRINGENGILAVDNSSLTVDAQVDIGDLRVVNGGVLTANRSVYVNREYGGDGRVTVNDALFSIPVANWDTLKAGLTMNSDGSSVVLWYPGTDSFGECLDRVATMQQMLAGYNDSRLWGRVKYTGAAAEISDSYKIPRGIILELQGDLTVSGALNVNGRLRMRRNAVLNVTGSMDNYGTVELYEGSQYNLSGAMVNYGGGMLAVLNASTLDISGSYKGFPGSNIDINNPVSHEVHPQVIIEEGATFEGMGGITLRPIAFIVNSLKPADVITGADLDTWCQYGDQAPNVTVFPGKSLYAPTFKEMLESGDLAGFQLRGVEEVTLEELTVPKDTRLVIHDGSFIVSENLTVNGSLEVADASLQAMRGEINGSIAFTNEDFQPDDTPSWFSTFPTVNDGASFTVASPGAVMVQTGAKDLDTLRSAIKQAQEYEIDPNVEKCVLLIQPITIPAGTTVSAAGITLQPHFPFTIDGRLDIVNGHMRPVADIVVNGVLGLTRDSADFGAMVITRSREFTGTGVIEIHDSEGNISGYFRNMKLDGFRRAVSTANDLVLLGQSESAFASYVDLALPTALTTIESEAFAGGSFRSVYIPAGVTSIAADAFGNRTDLVILRGK